MMATALIQAPLIIPDRMWYANTDMASFNEVPRAPGDSSAFSHWLAAGKLFVSPELRNRRQSHRALTEMRPGDPIFAYENLVGFVAIGRVKDAKMHCTTSGGTSLFPDQSRLVDSIEVDWDTSITRHYQDVSARTKVGGHALQRCDSSMGLYGYLLEMLQEIHDRHCADQETIEAAAIKRIASNLDYSEKMRIQLGQARIGQGCFRAAVLVREPHCRVTNTLQAHYLVASHIKPWAVCTGSEHLDGANGLMLAPHVDHLFDTGLISFEDNGDLVLAPSLDPQVLQTWHIDAGANVGPFAPDQARYLAYHRQHVLGQPRPRRQRNLVGDAPADVAAFDDLLTAGGGQ